MLYRFVHNATKTRRANGVINAPLAKNKYNGIERINSLKASRHVGYLDVII